MNSIPTILIVDNTPTTLTLLFHLLGQEGFNVLVAESGEWALSQVPHLLPDLILMDVRTPDINGLETCRRLKAIPATQDIPVIFFTASAEKTVVAEGFAVGGVDYIVKPFNDEEVLARVRTQLTIRRLQQQLQERNEMFEAKVKAHTVTLQETNQMLEAEIERRQQQEQEKKNLFTLVQHQSEQLRNLTQWLSTSQQQQHGNLTYTLRQQIGDNLKQVEVRLNRLQYQPDNLRLDEPTTFTRGANPANPDKAGFTRYDNRPIIRSPRKCSVDNKSLNNS